MQEKHRTNTEERQHYTFSKKFALSLKPKFIYSGALRKLPGWQDAEHRHEFCEIMFIKSGTGTVEIGGTPYAVGEGDLVVYNAGIPHSEVSNPDNPMENRFCAAANIHLHGLAPGHLLPPHSSPVFSGREFQSFFEELFDRLVEEPENKGLYYKEISENLLKIIIHLILRLSVQSSDFQEINDVYFRVKTYLDERFAEPLTLDGICTEFFVSKSYLSHIFKELNGDAPMRYLAKVRLEHAKHSLRESNLPVRRVAESAGYSDECYFCRVFKQSVGMTPIQYRTACRDAAQ